MGALGALPVADVVAVVAAFPPAVVIVFTTSCAGETSLPSPESDAPMSFTMTVAP